MKRPAEPDAAESSAKRHKSELQQLAVDDGAIHDDLDIDSVSVFSDSGLSRESNFLPTQTPATAASLASTSSRANRKFPSDLKTIKCTYPSCPKTFNRPARLTAHLRSHTNDRPFKCPYNCGKDYLEEKHLKQHIKGSHTQERKYACEEPGCTKSFVTATRLRRHAAVHEGAERFRCRGHPGCDRSFRKHQTLQRHIRTDHLNQAAYPCGNDSCEEGFDTAGALKRHIERMHGELRFWCDECDKANEEGEEPLKVGFTTLAFLQAHMRNAHVNCLFCDIKCSSQLEVERHIELYHSGLTVEDRKTVACTWEGCNKKFVKAQNLKMHIKTAHEGFRFVCGEENMFDTKDIADWNWMEEGCGKGFISKLKLQEHVRFIHLGQRRPQKTYAYPPPPANIIDDLSGVTEAEKRHVTCNILGCTARFIRHHDLQIHIRQAHNNGHEDQDMEDLLAEAGHFGIDQATGYKTTPPDLDSGGDYEPENDDTLPFWFASGDSFEPQQSGFEEDWNDMRKLIDVDALVDVRQNTV